MDGLGCLGLVLIACALALALIGPEEEQVVVDSPKES